MMTFMTWLIHLVKDKEKKRKGENSDDVANEGIKNLVLFESGKCPIQASQVFFQGKYLKY